MEVWKSEIEEMKSYIEITKSHLAHIEKDLLSLTNTQDGIIILVYSRRILEIIISDICEKKLNRARGTEPLKVIIDKLNKEEILPPYVITSMNNLNSISTYGAHPKQFNPRQVKCALIDLGVVFEWFLVDSKIPIDSLHKKRGQNIEKESCIDAIENSMIINNQSKNNLLTDTVEDAVISKANDILETNQIQKKLQEWNPKIYHIYKLNKFIQFKLNNPDSKNYKIQLIQKPDRFNEIIFNENTEEFTWKTDATCIGVYKFKFRLYNRKDQCIEITKEITLEICDTGLEKKSEAISEIFLDYIKAFCWIYNWPTVLTLVIAIVIFNIDYFYGFGAVLILESLYLFIAANNKNY